MVNLAFHPVFAVSFDFSLFVERVVHPTSQQWNAVVATVAIAVIAEAGGVLLGLLTYAGARARFAPFRVLAYLYALVFRGTPVLVQIFFVYFGANLFFGFDLFPREANFFGLVIPGAAIAGTVALAINEGAYTSETIRAGIDSIDPGQREAARSVGMSNRTAMAYVVLPQAVRVIIPPLGNQFNTMLKTTSLLSLIGVYELLQDAQVVYARNFQPAEVLAAVAMWYLVLTLAWSLLQVQLERRFGASDRAEDEGLLARVLGVEAASRGAR